MKTKEQIKKEKRVLRKKRIRAKVSGTTQRPRLSIFRSNKFIYGQLIDDDKGNTLVAVSVKDLKVKGKKVDQAKEAGIKLGKKILDKKIKGIVFDRGGYKYTGRVKAFAEGLREAGVKF